MELINKKKALLYHSKFPSGKIQTFPSKSYKNQNDLSLAYSPGVAEPCKEINMLSDNIYKYTNKGNLVAVISNGTAVLGLGNIGAYASKPVMEGKGLLFKIFAGIDVFDIEINENNKYEFIKIVKAISPTFGGINLEDIKAPEAFEIEDILKSELNIPVMHDDQHGTAIISASALINALKIVNKNINDVNLVVNGAGSAAIACARMYKKIGINADNIIMCDSKGVINDLRNNLSKEKLEFITKKPLKGLKDAIKNCDIFIGLSIANILTPDMLLLMNKNPIVFAMANPNPEIDYNLALKTRSDVLMATGRSDFPNQVNNVLGFPYIFRGALDINATQINEDMKFAAIYAIAELAKEPVPKKINIAYKKEKILFGKDYIIPKPLDNRLLYKVSTAVAKAGIKSGIARNIISNWDDYNDYLLNRINFYNNTMNNIK